MPIEKGFKLRGKDAIASRAITLADLLNDAIERHASALPHGQKGQRMTLSLSRKEGVG